MADFFAAVRSMFEYAQPVREAAAAAKTHVAGEGNLSIEGLRHVRFYIGLLVPSRLYADAFIILLLFGFAIMLAFWTFNNCRQLGCAVLRMVVCCTCLFLTVFWLFVACRLSNEEFHSTFVESAEWIGSALGRVVARK